MAECTAPGADVLPVVLELQARSYECHAYDKLAKKPLLALEFPTVPLVKPDGTNTVNAASARPPDNPAEYSSTRIVASVLPPKQ